MEKRAISEVMSMVLIIMISVVAVGILSAVVIPLVRTNISFNSACNTASLGVYLDSASGDSCLDKNNGILSVNIKKKDLELNISRVKLNVFSDDGSHTYLVDVSRFSGKIIYLNVSELEEIEKVELYPLVQVGKKNKECDRAGSINIRLCNPDVSFEKEEVIGSESSSSSGGGSSSCVPNCSCAETTLVGGVCDDGCGGFCEGVKRDGSLSAPFAISTCSQLQNIAKNLSAHYILINDVDCRGFEFNPLIIFNGSLNGLNNTISNLVFNGSNQYLKCLSRSNVSLIGSLYGNISSIIFNNSYFHRGGCPSGTQPLYTSGLATYSYGKIENVHFLNGYVRSTMGSYGAGIVQNNYGSIIGSSFEGVIDGHSCAGIAFYNYGKILSSYVIGEINCKGMSGSFSYVGGLVVNNGGLINNSFFRGSILGNFIHSAGLVKDNPNYVEGSNDIYNSYSVADMYGGGCVIYGGKASKNSFYDKTICELLDTRATGRSTEQMKNLSTFTSVGWDFDNVWTIDSNKNEGYPYLRYWSL